MVSEGARPWGRGRSGDCDELAVPDEARGGPAQGAAPTSAFGPLPPMQLVRPLLDGPEEPPKGSAKSFAAAQVAAGRTP